MKKTFQVSVEKEQLIFSVAHFITFGDNVCEQIHGHNYRVQCQVSGPLEANGYVVDFIALRDQLLKITSEWDHHVLLPLKHPTIKVESDSNEVTVRFEDRRWVFPKQDCVLLDIDNTTAERMAELIGTRLIEDFFSTESIPWTSIRIGVDENEGQWAYCQFDA